MLGIYEILHHPTLNNFLLFRLLKRGDTLRKIFPLLKALEPYTHELVVFGSRGKGTQGLESDFDLFIVTDEKESVDQVLSEYEDSLDMDAVVWSSELRETLETKEPEFWKKLQKGWKII